MGNAIIGYENLLENGSVVASSEDASFPVANVYDWLMTDYFKPAGSGTINITLTLGVADTADYFAFYNHNLYSVSGTIKLQWWDGAIYQDCFTAITPTDNKPVLVTFSAKTSTLWRVVITCSSVFSIAVISFGEKLSLQQGMYLDWTPPPLGRATQLITSKADTGAFLGRSIVSKGVRTDLVIQQATDAWVRANWLIFARVAEKRAFFFVADYTNNPTECVFCWVEEEIPSPRHTGYGYMSVSIPIRGCVE